MAQLLQVLKTTKVEDLAATGGGSNSEMTLLNKDETVLSALKKLTEAGVVTAPVVHLQDDDQSKHPTGVGLIDMLDILAYIVDLFTESEARGTNIFDRLENGGKLAREKISTITDFAHNPFTPVEKGKSIYDACQILLKNKSHRCPIVDENGKIVGMLTQAAIVNFFAQHFQLWGSLSKENVGSLKLGTKPVITVPKTMRTIDAFKVMHEHKISGLGVVDSSGILIGNLSARDLKHLDASNIYSCMYTSASHFVQRVRANCINIVHPAISCTNETDLAFVIGRLSANRIHRLYICDKDLRPTGVISLRDVIGCVLDNIEKTSSSSS